MKKQWFTVLFLCVSLFLSSCGTASESGNVTKDMQTPDSTVDTPEESAPDSTVDTSEDSTVDNGSYSAVDAVDDFTQIAGTWYADAGTGLLSIYNDGTFMQSTPDGEEEGYLEYTEAEGGLWESSPRYEMYDWSGERVPETFLAFDDAHPGKLVYAVGGGAELFSRGDSVYDDNGVTVRVQYTGESFPPKFGEFDVYTGEYEIDLLFTTERTVKEFKVLSIALSDVDDDGTAYFTVEELYEQDELTPELPLMVRTSFPGDMPNNGISFVGADGVTRYYSVNQSGFDGSLSLNEFHRAQD